MYCKKKNLFDDDVISRRGILINNVVGYFNHNNYSCFEKSEQLS
jgi:hypothetical protein